VIASDEDSLTLAYSFQLANGYFDGEERSIPIFEQGMLQTHGDFKLIKDTATYSFVINSDLGKTTIHAEATSLEIFLREIEKVERYPYMCNEQMASKIKVLLSKKRIANIFGHDFKEDKKINNLISRLNKNKNSDGLWGWWNKDKTEYWISKQIIDAMLEAEAAGFKIDFDKNMIGQFFEKEIKKGLFDLSLVVSYSYTPMAKTEMLDRLIYLKKLNAPIDYEAYFKQIDGLLKSKTTFEKLKTMQAMSVIGLEKNINTDSLMHFSHKTMLGSLYWGDNEKNIQARYRFIKPYQNNTETTLIAYNILKSLGGYESELEQIQNYFFERRHDAAWENTYESSRIIETIMPDMLEKSQSYEEVSMYINDTKISKFPYTETLDVTEPIKVRKEGTLPIFVTAYQQGWNKNPRQESAKGFSIKSYFLSNQDTVAHLTAGKVSKLEVLVTVDTDAEYVQIEVPIPAGCSYDSKNNGNYLTEVHREYFKEKVVIFSNRLNKGEHKFTVELIPRYSGQYFLNLAKAELMYFPTFYGNEQIKTLMIEEESK